MAYEEGSFESELYELYDRVRRMLGAGYGQGHEPKRLADIIETRNEVFVKLTLEETAEAMRRDLPMAYLLESGKISFEEYRARRAALQESEEKKG